ncbi:MAG: hypothetical protein U1C33_08010, partial [Candidatus Cloacimonadaceae bacterium]|nr:hypothetical protein [Candidatus Cloacimonadaceae bacterium]
MKQMVLIATLLLSVLALAAQDQYLSVKDRFTWYYETDLITETQISEINWTPEFSLSVPLSASYLLQAEYSMQARASSTWQDSQQEGSISMKSYRYWVRFSSSHSELRAGLQRLSFGTAQVLRPLQWFDQINPTDINEETKGVPALLARHYFENNAGLWAWGILSNGRIKGNEYLPSQDNSLEFGGRISYPLGNQEIGLGYHHRKLEQDIAADTSTEHRLGLDFRTDWVFGLWMESSISHFTKTNALPNANSVSTTLGVDYTFDWGNGIYVLCENMLSHRGSGSLASLHARDALAALMVDYPLGLLDKLSLLNIYDYKAGKSLHTIMVRRTYDYLSFQLSFASDLGQKFANRGVKQIYAG